MISRVALTGIQPAEEGFSGRSIALVLHFCTIVLVLFLSATPLRAQEPEQWPQDDDTPQQPVYDSPGSQQSYDYAQNAPQPEYGGQPGYGQEPGSGEQLGYMPSQALNAQQLEQLVAPIALYPDSLIAQILAASTYPAEIAAADQWVRSIGSAPPEQIAAGANSQTGWDPSVKALTAYPQVLAMMNQNLQWTTSLGNAYYNQPQDVTETIQVLRQRAQSAGNLQSTPQEQVTSDQGYIAVAPANPEVVYVPTYNPWVVYGQPIMAYPGYEPIDTVGAIVGSAVQFGLEFAVGAFFRAPFGFMGWGLDWFGHAVLFDRSVWCSRSASLHDWGFPHGGPRYFRGGEWARGGRGGWGDHYGRGGYGNGYGRGGYGNGYGRGGYGNGGSYANHNQPGFSHGRGQYPGARPGGGYGYGGGNQYGRDRGGNYAGARPGTGEGRYLGGSSRGSLGYNSGSGRGFLGSGSRPQAPQQYALNRGASPAPLGGAQTYRGNPQFFSNRGGSYGYGSQTYARPPQVSNYGRSPFGSGGGQSYRVPSQGPSFGHGFSRSPGSPYGGNYGQSSHSGGGFHLFGGGHSSSPSFGGGGHSFGGSGGGHSSFGGGHSFGGGGRSFGGGGHSFGGGHSSGGHSGGGGHHR
jgi:Protein of unknown function (DUF3300)